METLNNYIQDPSYWLLLGIGIGLKLFIGMRRFKRRGAGGLQHFHHYFIGLITLALEWIGQVIAKGMILWGALGLLFT